MEQVTFLLSSTLLNREAWVISQLSLCFCIYVLMSQLDRTLWGPNTSLCVFKSGSSQQVSILPLSSGGEVLASFLSLQQKQVCMKPVEWAQNIFLSPKTLLSMGALALVATGLVRHKHSRYCWGSAKGRGDGKRQRWLQQGMAGVAQTKLLPLTAGTANPCLNKPWLSSTPTGCRHSLPLRKFTYSPDFSTGSGLVIPSTLHCCARPNSDRKEWGD